MTTQTTQPDADTNPYNGARFLYVRETVKTIPVGDPDTPTGVVTSFAYRFDDAAKEVVFASSRCSKKDRYERAIGRDLAYERLESGETGALPYRLFPESRPTFRTIAAMLSALAQ